MVEAQRALLDELMGTARNLTEEEKVGYKEVRWDDKEVCSFYLVRFCPHDLFVNTRNDLGPCPRIHELRLKESFQQSTRYDLYLHRYEAQLAQFCEKLVLDLDRKVKRGRERLAQDVDLSSLVPIPTERADQLATIEEKIRKLLEQIESLGEEGKVDEAQALMKKVDILNAEKTVVMQLASTERGIPLTQEKKMAICEICGSFLVANDAIERTQSHVTGKLHMGYAMVHEYLAEYRSKKDKASEDERQTQEKDVDERKKRESEKVKENGRDRDRDDYEKERMGSTQGRRERGREQHGRSRERERERERERDSLRDRDRDRERDKYRDRDGGRFSRERERDPHYDRTWDRDRKRGQSRSPFRPSSHSPGHHHHGRRRSRSPDHIV